jgi:hypothetical protein
VCACALLDGSKHFFGASVAHTSLSARDKVNVEKFIFSPTAFLLLLLYVYSCRIAELHSVSFHFKFFSGFFHNDIVFLSDSSGNPGLSCLLFPALLLPAKRRREAALFFFMDFPLGDDDKPLLSQRKLRSSVSLCKDKLLFFAARPATFFCSLSPCLSLSLSLSFSVVVFANSFFSPLLPCAQMSVSYVRSSWSQASAGSFLCIINSVGNAIAFFKCLAAGLPDASH